MTIWKQNKSLSAGVQATQLSTILVEDLFAECMGKRGISALKNNKHIVPNNSQKNSQKYQKSVSNHISNPEKMI